MAEGEIPFEDAFEEYLAATSPGVGPLRAVAPVGDTVPYYTSPTGANKFPISEVSRQLLALSSVETWQAALGVTSDGSGGEVSEQYMPFKTMWQLGMKSRIKHGSQTAATMTLNTQLLQSYADLLWRADRQALIEECDLFFYNGSVTFGGLTGMPSIFSFGGSPIWHTVSDYMSGGRGGPCGVKVWGGSDLDQFMWHLRGHGGVIAAPHFMGKWDWNDYDELLTDAVGDPYPYADPFASHPNDDRCLGAIRFETDYPLGSGKYQFPRGFSGMLFRTAMRVYDDPLLGPSDELADQHHFEGISRFYYSDVGYECDQLQSFSTSWDKIDTGFCTCPLRFVKGGKSTIGLLDMQAKTRWGLLLNGTDSGGLGDCDFTIERANYDETNDPNFGMIYKVDPQGGSLFSAANVYVNKIKITSGRASSLTQASNKPIVSIARSGGENYLGHIINGYDGMIHVEGGTAQRPNYVTLDRGNFMAGRHDPASPHKVCDNASDGHVIMELVGMREQHGADGSNNDGDFYHDGRVKIRGIMSGGSFTPYVP